MAATERSHRGGVPIQDALYGIAKQRESKIKQLASDLETRERRRMEEKKEKSFNKESWQYTSSKFLKHFRIVLANMEE